MWENKKEFSIVSYWNENMNQLDFLLVQKRFIHFSLNIFFDVENKFPHWMISLTILH